MRSVITALQVLEAAAVNQPIGLSALTRTLRLPKTTVQHSLATLADAGWIEQQAGSGRWQVVVRAFVAGSAVSACGGLWPAALPTMRDLGAEVGETVDLMVPAGGEWVRSSGSAALGPSALRRRSGRGGAARHLEREGHPRRSVGGGGGVCRGRLARGHSAHDHRPRLPAGRTRGIAEAGFAI